MSVHLWLHRLALALLRRHLARRPPRPSPGRPRVTFLLLSAWGLGGTTRTVLNTAGYLSKTRDVEILSLFRRRLASRLPRPEGVRYTAIDDLRPAGHGSAEALARKVLGRIPSVLLFPGDGVSHRETSLWTDVQILRTLPSIPAGVLIATRPALIGLATAAARNDLVAVGQEHINLAAHNPTVLAAIPRVYRRLDAIVVLTEHDREAYLRDVPGVPVHVIPNAVPDLGPERPTLDEPVIVAVGRLAPQKGFDRLLDAFAQVVERHPDWTLRICGGGVARGRLERRAKRLGITDEVEFLGPVSDVGAQLCGASIFALSSRFEGLPMAMLEAMSKGLPVVAFDCPTGPREVAGDGRGAVLVPNGDIDRFADALSGLIADPQHRRRLGAAAERRALDFSMDAVGRRWLAFLAEVEGPRPPG